ncbi:unnamed protein product [Closterium sp. Naga37s-1]|nr:unnamed protein product [Closterium sp. Naga37s-1]
MGRGRKGREATGRDGQGREGTGRDGQGREGTGNDGKAQEGAGRGRKGREGAGRDGEDVEGREGLGRNGKRREKEGHNTGGRKRWGEEGKWTVLREGWCAENRGHASPNPYRMQQQHGRQYVLLCAQLPAPPVPIHALVCHLNPNHLVRVRPSQVCDRLRCATAPCLFACRMQRLCCPSPHASLPIHCLPSLRLSNRERFASTVTPSLASPSSPLSLLPPCLPLPFLTLLASSAPSAPLRTPSSLSSPVFSPSHLSVPRPQAGAVRINCGSSEAQTINGRQWRADSFYDAGQPFRLPPSPPLSSPRLASPVEATLRAFPGGNSNGGCYTVPLPRDARYLVRVGVAYRNYDGALRPPAFHMAVNGLILRTVVMAVSEQQYPLSAFYSEFVAFARQGRISVCFLPLLGVVAAPPQVNSLELLPVHPLAYDGAVTGRDVVVVPLLRHNLGATRMAGGGAGDGVPLVQEDRMGGERWERAVGGTVGRVAELEGEEAEAANGGGLEGRGKVGQAGAFAVEERGLPEEGAGKEQEGGMREGGWAEEDSAYRVWGRDLAPAWGAVPRTVALNSDAGSGASSSSSSSSSSSVGSNATLTDSSNWVTRGHPFNVVTTSRRIAGADVAPDFIPSAVFQSAWEGAVEERAGEAGEESGGEQLEWGARRGGGLVCWANSSSGEWETCMGSVGFAVRLDPVNLLDVLCLRLFFAELDPLVRPGDRRFDIRLGAMSVLGVGQGERQGEGKGEGVGEDEVGGDERKWKETIGKGKGEREKGGASEEGVVNGGEGVRDEERLRNEGSRAGGDGEAASSRDATEGLRVTRVEAGRESWQGGGGTVTWQGRGERLQRLSSHMGSESGDVRESGVQVIARRAGGVDDGEGAEEGKGGHVMDTNEEREEDASSGRRRLLGEWEGVRGSKGMKGNEGGERKETKQHSSRRSRRKGERAEEIKRRRVGVEHIAHTGLDGRKPVVHGNVVLDAVKSISESGEFDTGGGVGTPVNWYRNFLDFRLHDFLFGPQPRPWQQERQQLLRSKRPQVLGHWEGQQQKQQQQQEEEEEEVEDVFDPSNPLFARDWSGTGFDILVAANGSHDRAVVVQLCFNFTRYAQQYGPDLALLLSPMRGSKRPPLLAGVEVVEMVRTPPGGHVPRGYLPNDIAAMIVLLALAYFALKLAPHCCASASHFLSPHLPFTRFLPGPIKGATAW